MTRKQADKQYAVYNNVLYVLANQTDTSINTNRKQTGVIYTLIFYIIPFLLYTLLNTYACMYSKFFNKNKKKVPAPRWPPTASFHLAGLSSSWNVQSRQQVVNKELSWGKAWTPVSLPSSTLLVTQVRDVQHARPNVRGGRAGPPPTSGSQRLWIPPPGPSAHFGDALCAWASCHHQSHPSHSQRQRTSGPVS